MLLLIIECFGTPSMLHQEGPSIPHLSHPCSRMRLGGPGRELRRMHKAQKGLGRVPALFKKPQGMNHKNNHHQPNKKTHKTTTTTKAEEFF